MFKVTSDKSTAEWDIIIKPKSSLFDFKLKEILAYRDLLFLLVRRDIIVRYKQTILGPLWIIIQPILTTVMFVIIFSKLAKLSTNNIPPALFYLSGTIFWNFIADIIRINSDSFKSNVDVFSKVYFPRVIVPIATSGTVLFQFMIQFILFLLFLGYYLFTGYSFEIGWDVVIFPFLLLIAGAFSLGLGLLLSSLTFKYRDFHFLISFGIQLAMYATPVIYPLSSAPDSLAFILLLNPVTSLIEAYRFIFLGVGVISQWGLFYSTFAALFSLLAGLLIFNRTEKNFMDTV